MRLWSKSLPSIARWLTVGAACWSSLLCGSLAHAQVGSNLTGVLNPNLASVEELAAVNGLSTDSASAIVDGRPYLTVSDLHAELSMQASADAIDSILERVFVPVDLNRASREEILLVPGVGERMAHEFEEYRPYVGLEQFRREIGKYVDDDQVARYEQYVFVPLDLNTASRDDLATIPGVGKRMVHEFLEYRPYVAIAQFRREIGKYVDADEVARLERYFVLVPVPQD